MYGYIYLTENLITGHCYIGKRAKSRFDTKYKGSGTLLKRALNKYGWDNFVCQPIEWCETPEELIEKEKYWIKKCNAVFDEGFYNLQIGGDGGGHFGMKQSEHQKQRAREANTGRKHTLEEKELMKQNHKDFHRGNHPQAKKIICTNNGRVYDCINDAAEDTGIDRHKISNCCKGIIGSRSPIELMFEFYKEVQ